MHPSALLEIKKIVRESTLAELRKMAEGVMRAHDTRELHQLVDEMNSV